MLSIVQKALFWGQIMELHAILNALQNIRKFTVTEKNVIYLKKHFQQLYTVTKNIFK